MSYTVRHTAYVRHSFHYPASEHGGSTSEDVPVDIAVTVNTEPFDASVASCSSNLLNLAHTTASAANEIVDAKAEAAQRISASIIKGFSGLIINEIRQKMVELVATIPAKLQELKSLAANCLARHEQMTNDYERITSRYTKLFNSLDDNLHAAILELDRPIFAITSSFGNVVLSEGVLNQFVSEGSFAGSEQVSDATMLQIARLKQNARQIIEETGRNIGFNRELDNKISDMVQNVSLAESRKVFMPAVVMTTGDGESYCNVPGGCPNDTEATHQLLDAITSMEMPDSTDEEIAKIDIFLRKNLSAFVEKSGKSTNTDRVAENVMRMWNSVRDELSATGKA